LSKIENDFPKHFYIQNEPHLNNPPLPLSAKCSHRTNSLPSPLIADVLYGQLLIGKGLS